ncbi:hypothetical protein ACGFZK_01470 [Streptomyces sp. NPDC048257]|uniref:hypothetical protein n=1 Tax=Streptomyces sp. NPDC048257 TaxID=3365526 RepID=UPI003719973A
MRFTPLTELDSISVAGDPLAEVQGAVKILAEFQYNQSRLVAYANSDSCGILAVTDSEPKGNRIHLVTKWPTESEGSNTYPAGPYNSASGAGGTKTWAFVLCSKSAMVIEYTPGENGGPKQSRGQATVTAVPNTPDTSRIIIGDPGARRQIEDQTHRSAPPTP